MLDLVEKLANSGNKVLEAAANDFSKWSKLKHNKQDLELFLQYNLVHMKFKPKKHIVMKEIVCTSNTRFIALFSARKTSQKNDAKKIKFDGIQTKDQSSVLTYNLIEGKYNTIDLSMWEIISFITMSEDNVDILDAVTNEMLKRKIVDDLKK